MGVVTLGGVRIGASGIRAYQVVAAVAVLMAATVAYGMGVMISAALDLPRGSPSARPRALGVRD